MTKLFNLTEIDVDEIIVKDRARKDIGDLTILKESITKSGLLNPILITSENHLIAGERRLKAFKELKLPNILARVMPDMEEDDLLIIERMENVARKEFTWHEELDLRYKLHQYWKMKAQSNNLPWGYRETAKKLNYSIASLSTDLALAEALQTFPELKEMQTKGKAREAYKKMGEQAEAIQKMKSLSPEEQERFAAIMSGKVILKSDGEEKKKTMLKAKHPDQTPEINFNPDGSTSEQTIEEIEPVEEDKPSLPEVVYAIEKLETFIPKVPDNTVGFVELDPPYAIDFNTNYGKVSKIKSKANDWSNEQLFDFYIEILPILHAKMLDSSWIFCWTGKEHWLETNKIAEKSGFSVQMPGIWVKPSGSTNTPKTNMVSNYEMFLLFRKGQATFNTASMLSTINYTPPSGSKRSHQWEKPLEMYEYILSVFSRPGSIFLSPFAGSGNSLIAAAKADMIPMGCDEQQKYVYQFYDNLKKAFSAEEDDNAGI